MAVPAVFLAGLAARLLGVRLRFALGERCRLALRGPLRLLQHLREPFYLALELPDMRLELLDLLLKLTASWTARRRRLLGHPGPSRRQLHPAQPHTGGDAAVIIGTTAAKRPKPR